MAGAEHETNILILPFNALDVTIFMTIPLKNECVFQVQDQVAFPCCGQQSALP